MASATDDDVWSAQGPYELVGNAPLTERVLFAQHASVQGSCNRWDGNGYPMGKNAVAVYELAPETYTKMLRHRVSPSTTDPLWQQPEIEDVRLSDGMPAKHYGCYRDVGVVLLGRTDGWPRPT